MQTRQNVEVRCVRRHRCLPDRWVLFGEYAALVMYIRITPKAIIEHIFHVFLSDCQVTRANVQRDLVIYYYTSHTLQIYTGIINT